MVNIPIISLFQNSPIAKCSDWKLPESNIGLQSLKV